MALTQATFLQLITRLASDLDDLMILEATSTGTTTTFIDNVNINNSRDSPDGWEFWLYSQDAVATVSQSSGSTLTLTPALPTNPLTGADAYLVNKRGRGFRIAEYKRAINNAITDFNGVARVETVETISPVYDEETQTVTIPATLAEVYRVEYQDSAGFWQEIKRAAPRGGYGWTAEPSNAMLRIEGYPAYLADGYAVRLHGYKFQEQLSATTDVCYYEPGGIVARAAYYLCKSAISRDARYAQMVLLYKDESEAMMRRAKITRQPGTQKVRV